MSSPDLWTSVQEQLTHLCQLSLTLVFHTGLVILILFLHWLCNRVEEITERSSLKVIKTERSNLKAAKAAKTERSRINTSIHETKTSIHETT